MKLDRYELKAGSSLKSFEFLSEGKNGKVVKIIQFQKMNLNNLFNIAFGDKDFQTGNLDDMAITDNGDADKVLATVVSAIYAFTYKYPDSWIYATGSTAAKTRFYRMGINKYFEIAIEDFEIMGEIENEWEYFEVGKNYQAFAVKK